jgi:hypothetical protein
VSSPGEASPAQGTPAHGWRAPRVRIIVPGALLEAILLAGQIGCRQNVWFHLTDEMLVPEGRHANDPGGARKAATRARRHGSGCRSRAAQATATAELSFHKTYRHLYEGEKREQAKRLEALVLAESDEEGTEDGDETAEGLNQAVAVDGRYWARTSDPQLVELVLSQLS